jgi:hypothetical protein
VCDLLLSCRADEPGGFIALNDRLARLRTVLSPRQRRQVIVLALNLMRTAPMDATSAVGMIVEALERDLTISGSELSLMRVPLESGRAGQLTKFFTVRVTLTLLSGGN